jgi:hypothetical protein
MSTELVWNISDQLDNELKSMVISVLGKTIAPGKCVKVPMSVIKSAHQLKKLEAAGLIFIGKEPGYQASKKALVLPDKVARSHGEVPTDAIVAEAPKAVDNALKEDDYSYGFKKKKSKF